MKKTYALISENCIYLITGEAFFDFKKVFLGSVNDILEDHYEQVLRNDELPKLISWNALVLKFIDFISEKNYEVIEVTEFLLFQDDLVLQDQAIDSKDSEVIAEDYIKPELLKMVSDHNKDQLNKYLKLLNKDEP